MASTSSAPNPHKYDVFLSFRGEDTRYSFTDYLYDALRKAGITTFRDDDEIQEGQELKPEIERAIAESKASVIVISKNYANSSWCLEELWLILKQKWTTGHFVLPVFYGAEPSDVRNQQGSFNIKAKYIFTRSKWTKDNVNRWKAALREVAELKGMVVSGYEKDLIAKIVENVYHQLALKIGNIPTDLTGIETRAERINTWLRSEQPDHPVFSICGIGGSGKTTLAKHIYYSNKHDFVGCCFLEEIGNQPGDLLGAQNKLLSDISRNNNMMISDVHEGAFQLLKAIQNNRVLIVVDDIDDKDKLSTLFGTQVFQTQSKIIITTRTLNIDTWFGSISWRCKVYKIELLNPHESLELTSPPIPHKYDVFLSFRGEDTRYSFIDHLYDALYKAGITTFRDDNEIQEGQELKPEIERAITESEASIVVISKNYANSIWCLGELWLILEQRRTTGDFVLPVFYGVDPSDVRNQRGSFTIEAKEGDEASKWTKNNVKRWKAALREVANLKGMVVSGYEKDFIAKIVDKVYHRLGSEIHNRPTDLTGIETRAEPIISWLRSDHPVLAICGMGGGGKTTLAEYIYFTNKKNFDSCSLLKDINENQPDGLLGVQKQLFKDISGNSNMMISNVYEGAFQLQKAIQMNKVIIVVDDIDDKEKLTTLFGSKVFTTQSKIIVTRIQNIDTWFGSISYGCRVHKIELLNDQESLELLSWHAFGSKSPIEGFEKLAVELAQYCEGNPLALKVLGSSLFVRAQDQWTGNNMIEIWRSRLDSLDNNIERVLRRKSNCLRTL